MKIAQVNSYFYPFMIGGAEWYVYNISRELVKAGHDVTVFTADHYGRREAPPESVVEGIKVRRIPLKVDWSYRMKLWDGLSEAISEEDFDIIHTYDYAQKHTLDALRAGKKSGVGTALTIFDVHSSIPRRWYKRIPMSYLDGYFANRTLPMATRILIRAPDLMKDVPGLDRWEDKVRVSPSGVRPESFLRYDGDQFKRLHSIEGSPVVLYLGRINPLKGPQHIVEVAPRLMKEFPDIAFVFVGPDQVGYRAVLESRARELAVASHVYFTGMIERFEEKMQAYSSCDVFCLPTSYEGTSQAIFEAMTQGKPIISTKTGGIPFQIEEGREGFLVEFGDLDALADSLARTLRNSPQAREMGAQARSRAMQFQYPNLAAELQSVYREIVQSVGS